MSILHCPFCGVIPKPFSYPDPLGPMEVTCDDEECPAFNIVVSVEAWNTRTAVRPEHHDTPPDSAPTGEHPHNDGLDEYRQPVHVGELDPAQRLALARGELK